MCNIKMHPILIWSLSPGCHSVCVKKLHLENHYILRRVCSRIENWVTVEEMYLNGVYRWSIEKNPNPNSTCHVGWLGKNILLCAACSIVFLCEVGVTGRISQSGRGQKHVHAWAKHPLEIICDHSADFLSLYEVVLEVPTETSVNTYEHEHTNAHTYSE